MSIEIQLSPCAASTVEQVHIYSDETHRLGRGVQTYSPHFSSTNSVRVTPLYLSETVGSLVVAVLCCRPAEPPSSHGRNFLRIHNPMAVLLALLPALQRQSRHIKALLGRVTGNQAK